MNEESWHLYKMPYGEALRYHQRELDNGNITVCVEDGGDVKGYYQRKFIDNTCFFFNLYIKADRRLGRVFRNMRKSFFGFMPNNIERIIGTKQKLGRIDIKRR